MNTEAMNNNDITNTGTGPLENKFKIIHQCVYLISLKKSDLNLKKVTYGDTNSPGKFIKVN